MFPLALLLAASSAAAVPADPQAYQKALEKARAYYLTQAPGQPALDAAVKLPAPGPVQAQNDPLVRTAFQAAKDVELGCAAPCADPADVSVYAGQVELVARRLGLKDAQVDAALAHYLPRGKPRLRGAAAAAAATPGGRAVQAEVVARLLAQSRLAPQMRARLNQKALAMADALGRSRLISADAAGLVTLPDGRRGRLSAAQIASLNRLPETQAAILRHLATNPPPPPPTAQQRQDRVLAEADKEIAAHPGTIGSAYGFWDAQAKDPNSGWLWRGYAKLNKGLLTFSGLKSVEESSERLGWVWDNPDVSKGEKFWLGTKLAGNAALTAVTFLPAASLAQSLKAGEGFYWIGKGGTAVPGMVRAAPEAADAMNAAGRTLTRTIAESVPEGAKVGKEGLRELAANLNKTASRYGVRVIEGGTAGESVAKGGDIYVSLKAGAPHEMVHVVQQTYSRVLAVEEMAARAGVPVESLTAAQRAEAFANAAKWETASYAQLESQAWRATGFMGSGGGAKYGGQLLLAGQEVTAGMRDGAVLDGSFGLGARAYGRLTQVLGHSQAQIGLGVGSAFMATMNTPAVGDGVRDALDGAAQGFTAPAETPAVRSGARALSALAPAPALLLARPALARYAFPPASAP